MLPCSACNTSTSTSFLTDAVLAHRANGADLDRSCSLLLAAMATNSDQIFVVCVYHGTVLCCVSDSLHAVQTAETLLGVN